MTDVAQKLEGIARGWRDALTRELESQRKEEDPEDGPDSLLLFLLEGTGEMNGPATEEDLEEIESLMEEELPQEVRDLYLTFDGEVSGCVFYGDKFCSTADMLHELDWWIYPENQHYFDHLMSAPKGAVKKVEFHNKRLPMFADGNGNYIGVDLDPGPNGRRGQVINFGVDENYMTVYADSLGEFLDLVTQPRFLECVYYDYVASLKYLLWEYLGRPEHG